VVILPFIKPDTILLLRQKRHAVDQILLELPAGTLEKGENPMNCAGRELQEETGYLAGRMKPLGSFFSSPGILSEKMHAFVASELTRTHSALEEDEEIEVIEVGFEEAVTMIGTGEIQDAKSVATLLMYERFGRR
jgi:ADP-ribose pyrophosphatase